MNTATGKIFEKTTESDEVVGLGEGGERLLGRALVETIKSETISAKKLGSDVAGFEVLTRKILSGKLKKTRKIESVIFDGMKRATSFDFDMFKKIGD